MLTDESMSPSIESIPDGGGQVDLSGTWRCRLDRENRGEIEQWFAGTIDADTLRLQLPGSVQEQGVGDPIRLDTPWTGGVVDRSYFDDDRYAPYRQEGDVAVPFWLQPRVYYRGAAWFQREVEVPAEWSGRSVVLELERVHWESTVWLDDRRVGAERSLTTPHRFDLGALEPGTHRLTLRVDNRTVVDVGPNAHSISDHTQGNWNGVIGSMTLMALPAVRISRVRVEPHASTGTATVRVDLTSGSAGAGVGEVQVRARLRGSDADAATGTASFDEDHGRDLRERGMTAGGAHVDVELDLGPDAHTWDEFRPDLYDVTVELAAEVNGRTISDSASTVLGLRDVSVIGTQVAVNGRPTFIRGTLESCVFPLTGHPPTEVDAWRRIVAVSQEHGLNLLRFHSWCPPEAAFVAADEAGLYLQVEAPIWANQGAAIGEGRPVDAFLWEETRRILDTYGNHPSFLMMAHGNEPGGRDAEFLAAWVSAWRRYDPRRLYTSGAGWPAIEENDFDNIPDPRAHRWGEGLGSRLNARVPETCTDYRDWVTSRDRPIVSHEIGQWCAYPDLSEVERYTGLMQPANFGIFADFLREARMLDQAADFLDASGRLQALCYKEDIEAALRTEGFGGFHLLGLTDFPGQGTALVGVLNPFWESKGYIGAEEFARFCGPTVPLALLPQRVWSAQEPIRFDARIAHFGAQPLSPEVRWSLRGPGGEVLHEGSLEHDGPIPVGNGTTLGPVIIPAVETERAVQVTLAIVVTDALGATHENDWDLWVFPEPATTEPDGVSVTSDIERAIELAESGAVVLLELSADQIENEVALGFTPVFWNTAWTGGQAPHTLGVLHDAGHPIFDGFPTAGTTNWQWWEPLHGAAAMVLDALPSDLRPLAQPIDTWFEARRLGVVFEARLGRGRLLVSSLNLDDGGGRLAARALRRSVLDYVAGPRFAPDHEITPDQLRSVLGTH
ncbi:sugar-binding domain-containing protein [Pseudactinotalea sp.]|uniref:sugar-binding domain-containing protein n=1 Tax=Pseudactinotalea sp. TaxID=1926260 RepID=UPI003B3A4E36